MIILKAVCIGVSKFLEIMLKGLHKFTIAKKAAMIFVAVFLVISFLAPSDLFVVNTAYADPPEEKQVNGKKVVKLNGVWCAAEEIIIKETIKRIPSLLLITIQHICL
jgi:hypothetical protein